MNINFDENSNKNKNVNNKNQDNILNIQKEEQNNIPKKEVNSRCINQKIIENKNEKDVIITDEELVELQEIQLNKIAEEDFDYSFKTESEEDNEIETSKEICKNSPLGKDLNGGLEC